MKCEDVKLGGAYAEKVPAITLPAARRFVVRNWMSPVKGHRRDRILVRAYHPRGDLLDDQLVLSVRSLERPWHEHVEDIGPKIDAYITKLDSTMNAREILTGLGIGWTASYGETSTLINPDDVCKQLEPLLNARRLILEDGE